MEKYSLLLSLLTFNYSVQVFGKTLTFCIEPKDVYPLYRGQGQEKKKFPGLYLEMVSMLKKKLGVEAKIRRQPFKRCLRSLKSGRVDAVAAHENDGDQFLKKGSFKKSALPLASKDYFLLLSHKLNKAFSQKIWKGIADIRESESFKKIKDEYLRKGKW